ncbi:WYL domain-containing protein [Luteolibacter rhizosphaerae]|uniref:WYL domain-containing protein n=1 Tax=Luteolibacter rhizosphaerae TaxID=2989719 RepID=UPI003CE4862F
MEKLKHRPTLQLLRSAVAAGRDLTISYHGEVVTVEPHALLQANRSSAFVLAAWVTKSKEWGFFRFAEIRGVKFEKRAFVPRPDVPKKVPFRSTISKQKQD